MNSSLGGTEINGEMKFQCIGCNRYYKEQDFQETEKDVWAYKCEKCGKYIPNLSENWNFCGTYREIICPTYAHAKEGLVAIDGHHVSQIRSVKKDMVKRGHEIADDLYVLYVRRKKDRLALRYLNYLAQGEDESFRAMPSKTVRSYILLSKKQLLGYIVWTGGRLPTIRQLYVTVENRRRGYATALIRFFVKEQCPEPDHNGIHFCIESPNDASSHLFAKLGLLEINEDRLTSNKIRFVQGF